MADPIKKNKRIEKFIENTRKPRGIVIHKKRPRKRESVGARA